MPDDVMDNTTMKGAKKDKKGALVRLLDVGETPDDAFHGLCKPLSETPINSPKPKKMCGGASAGENEMATNSDILKAIRELNQRFSAFEM